MRERDVILDWLFLKISLPSGLVPITVAKSVEIFCWRFPNKTAQLRICWRRAAEDRSSQATKPELNKHGWVCARPVAVGGSAPKFRCARKNLFYTKILLP